MPTTNESTPFDVFIKSTKEDLDSDQVFRGLLDHGLFSEKIPPCFTTVGLADFIKNTRYSLLDESDERKLKKIIDECSHDYIRYEALRETNIPRHLGIPHPEAYAAQTLSIVKFWEEITTLCNKPKPQFSRIHVRNLGGGKIFEMNYKGREKYQFEEEEIEWMSGVKYIVEADIASCFPSIYTHSIPWALNGKKNAKKLNSIVAFSGNLIDKCTQNTKDRQTNGILIGPHASSIISEIILTRVDCDLQSKGYKKINRHIDDYRFYASSYDEAEKFLKDLGMFLRQYEMSLNDKKTKILSLPRPSVENWIQCLNRFAFPKNEVINFSLIRAFLDLALDCSLAIGKSTPLNYALKTLKGNQNNPKNLNLRAKRLYVQEAMNLAIAYPYLAPVLDKSVFEIYWYEGLSDKIKDFSISLVRLGIRKVYPDAIAHALYYALKYNFVLDELGDNALLEIITLEDCIANVLLYEYACKNKNKKLKSAIKKYGEEMKKSESRDRDKNWLLIFQLWTEKELDGCDQNFLADLKRKKFEFLSFKSFETA